MVTTTLIRGYGYERDRGLNLSAGLEVSKRLLHLVADFPSLGRIVRLYRPAPTVAFSRREEGLPGFADAVGEAMAFGFEPVIRPAGGRMVALDEDWLVLDVIAPEDRSRNVSHRSVFSDFGTRFVSALKSLGIDAAVGPVEGEYCPGDYSINARGEVKIVGTAQRVTRGARLFSACIPFALSPHAAELFDRVNDLLGLAWNPASLGSVSAEAPAATMNALENAILENFAPHVDRERELADVLSEQTTLRLAS